MSPKFHSLRIAEVRRDTPDAIVVRFEVPPALKNAYAFVHGQHVALRRHVQGRELRRSYSICSVAPHGDLRIAIKRVAGGLFSEWALADLRAGECIDVLTPEGSFHTPLDATHRNHYLALAAGSGITPIMSILTTTLAAEPLSRCTLLYCNQRPASALFQEELEDLKDRYLSRFTLYSVFSREQHDVGLYSGRLDRTKVARFLDALIPIETVDHAFVCGPGAMIDEVRDTLIERGLPAERLHSERFGVLQSSLPATRQTAGAAQAALTVMLDGRRANVEFRSTHVSILDAAIEAGLDLPYSCRGGMCCSCRAKLLEGEVVMQRNFSLEQREVEAGYVLTCQAIPRTGRITISFDER